MMMMIIIIMVIIIIIIVIITVDVDELMFSPLWVWQSFRAPWTSLLSAITIFTRILICWCCWSADADGIKGTSPRTRIIFIKQEWTATCEKQHSQEWESEPGDERRREWREGARRECPQSGLDQPFSLWKINYTLVSNLQCKFYTLNGINHSHSER